MDTSKKPLLQITDLHVSTEDQPILQGLNLRLGRGEVHVLMGKNGQGKTTLAQVLGGAPVYEVGGGEIIFQDENLLGCAPEVRAALGLFIGFQHPIAIPGVSIIAFLKAAMDALYNARKQKPMDAPGLLGLVKERMEELGLGPSLLSRSLNEGFSGGEKKRLELLQMSVLSPALAILDEPDSGLDADALRGVGRCLQRRGASGQATLIITHYTHLFDYITPDHVHVMHQGRIVKEGDASLAQAIFDQGYDAVITSNIF